MNGQRLLLSAVLCLFSIHAWAEPAEKSLGLVPLDMENVPRSTEKAINGQLRSTLSAISGVSVADVNLPRGTRATDVRALRTAVQAMLIDRVVGGRVHFEGDTGLVRLVSVDAAGADAVFAERTLPTLQHEEILSAIGATVCEAVGDLSSADGCQANLVIEGHVDGAQLVIDEEPVQKAPFIADIPVPLGAHKIQVRAGTLNSQERRIHIHFGSNVTLRVVEHCNQIFVLGHGEEPGCGETLPLVILNPDIGPTRTTLRLPALISTALGVAIVAGGVFFGMQASARADEIAAAHGAGIGFGDIESLQAAQRDMRTKATTANALYGAGGVLTAAGVGMFFIEF